MTKPAALIVGISGTSLTPEERDFLRDIQPLGVILFARNIETVAQTKALTDSIYDVLTHEVPLVLIDQEGGRVARLKAPEWPEFPPAAVFEQAGEHALTLNYQLQAEYLREIGVNVDCAPVCDVRMPDAHDIVGDRAFSEDPNAVAHLAGVACNALISGGVLPVIKHIPGHGRALVDSHEALPTVSASLEELQASDFVPFKALTNQALAMTAHIVYEALDEERCATHSPEVIRYIRDDIGFGGLLMTDDVSMHALGGAFEARAKSSYAAGCDVVLHCNGEPSEMQALARASRPLGNAPFATIKQALTGLSAAPQINRAALHAELNQLLAAR